MAKSYEEYLNRELDLLFIKEERKEESDISIKIQEYNDRRYKVYVTDIDGNEQGYDSIGEFIDDCALVSRNGKYNYINKKGYLLKQNVWYRRARPFKNGAGEVISDSYDIDYYNYLLSNGEYVSHVWYSQTSGYDIVASFYDNGFVDVINDKNFIITNRKTRVKGLFIENVNILEDLYVKKNDLKDYKLYSVKLGKFFCLYKSKNGSFTLKYSFKPLKIFDNRYVLYYDDDSDNKKIYLYNILTKKCKYLNTPYNIEYGENYILDKENDKMWLIYKEKMIDISNYYRKNLQDTSDMDSIKIDNTRPPILTEKEFLKQDNVEIIKTSNTSITIQNNYEIICNNLISTIIAKKSLIEDKGEREWLTNLIDRVLKVTFKIQLVYHDHLDVYKYTNVINVIALMELYIDDVLRNQKEQKIVNENKRLQKQNRIN